MSTKKILTPAARRSLAAHKANWTRKRPPEKQRRMVAQVIVSLSSEELNLELLRRSLSRTFVAMQHQEKALADLRRKYDRQSAETQRLAALIEGGTAHAAQR